MTNIKRSVPTDFGFEIEYEWRTYRFLLSDGRTLDMRAVEDGSWLRDEVLKVAKLGVGGRIEGVVRLSEPGQEAPKPVKAAARAKKAAPAAKKAVGSR